MAASSTFVSTFAVAGAVPSKICYAPQKLELQSSARLGIASPSAAYLRGSFVSLRRASKLSQPTFQVDCKTRAADGATVLAKEDGVVKKETSTLTPSTLQVQSFLKDICDETRIAELKLKVGDFVLHVKRDVTKATIAPAPVAHPPPAPVATVPSPEPAAKNNNVPSTSLLPATVSKTASLFGLLEAAADQGLSFVTSPKVGVFRRGRNVKGKIGRPLVDEGVIIKEGQVVGYLEQLGTQQPVEAQVSGEVVQVLWEDGEAVGYGDPLISIRPSFPGIVSRAALN